MKSSEQAACAGLSGRHAALPSQRCKRPAVVRAVLHGMEQAVSAASSGCALSLTCM
jgi:hypothetical protein